MRSDAPLRQRLRAEDGNTLLLMPAGVLILIVLAAIAVDAAIVFQAQREAGDVAAGLANDAASLLDEDRFYTAGEIAIDPTRVAALIALRLPQEQDEPLTLTCAPSYPGDERTVEIRCTGRTELLFTPALPGTGGLGEVVGTARARAESGP